MLVTKTSVREDTTFSVNTRSNIDNYSSLLVIALVHSHWIGKQPIFFIAIFL